MSKTAKSLLEEELDNISEDLYIFRNENVFSMDFFAPDNLLHREQQLRELVRLFKDIFNSNESVNYFQSVVLLGGNGTGKTSCAIRFGTDFEQLAKQKIPSVNFKYRHINCRRNQSIFLVLIDLLRSLLPYFPNRGFSAEELINMLQTYLVSTNSYLILTLDEIDYLFRDDDINLLLYNITRLNDQKDSQFQRISLILITRNKDFLFLLDSSIKSVIAKNVIYFPAYRNEEMYDILQNVVKTGFYDGVVDSSTIDTVIEKTGHKGDIRTGIELLWRAGKTAETEKTPIVLSEHVRIAQRRMNPFNSKVLGELDFIHKLVLNSIAKLFFKHKNNEKINLNQLMAQIISDSESDAKDVRLDKIIIESILNYLESLRLISLIFDTSKGKKHKKISNLTLEIPLEDLNIKL